MALAREIAGRSPGAVRGCQGAVQPPGQRRRRRQFAEERRVIGEQIGSANQVEAVMAGFENRPPVFDDVG